VIVNRFARQWSLLQHSFFILCLSTPAYLAAVATLASRGIGLAWYHRVGLAAVCLATAMAAIMVPGLVAVAVGRFVRHGRGRPGGRG
jgi:hypothetical protein